MAGKIKGIIIEIGGETTGLDKALADVNKRSRDLQKELREVEKLLKLDPSNTELVAQKQQLLSEQVANTKEKLDRLKEAQAQVNEQYEKGEIAEEQYRAFQREVAKTTSELERYESQLKDASKEQGGLKQALEQTAESMSKMGAKMSNIGKDMSLKVTAPIVAVGAAATAAWKEVDNALDTITTKTGATGEAADSMAESFRNVAKTMPVDMQSVGDAIGEVNTQFGQTGQALEKSTEMFLKFAQINGTDVSRSVQQAKGAIEAYGLSTDDLSDVLDAVTKAGQDTGLSVDAIFSAAVRGAPQIKAMGIEFADAAQMMGRFEQKGLDGEKALSYLAKAQVTWAKEGKTMQEGLAELQQKLADSTSETDRLSLASESFGTKGATFMLDAIERGALDLSDFGSAAEDAAGSVTTTFEATLDPIDKATVAFNNLKLVGADLGTSIQETLAPILDKLVELLQRLSDWFNGLSPTTQEWIVKIALLAAALGPVVLVAGQMISAFSKISGLISALGPIFTLLTGPVGLVVAAIAAAVAIGVTLWKNWDEIKEKLSDIWDSIKTTAETVWDGILQAIKWPINQIIKAINALIRGLNKISFSIPDWVPFLGGKSWGFDIAEIPLLAEGGIVTKPTLAVLGERGPEVVAPLEKLSGVTITQNLYFYGPADKTVVTTALDESNKKLVQKLRLSAPGVL